MKRFRIPLVVSICLIMLIGAFTAYAASTEKTITVSYNDIKLIVDEKQVTPRDASGNEVEPFIYNGTTYLPVRAVGEALGKDVNWDASTKTVVIGKYEEDDLISVQKLESRISSLKPVTSYGYFHSTYKDSMDDVLGNTHTDCFVTYSKNNVSGVTQETRPMVHSSVYNFEKQYSKLTGTLFMPSSRKSDYNGTIQIYNHENGSLISEISMSYFEEPKDFEVDVTGIRLIRIQMFTDTFDAAIGVCELKAFS